MVSKVEETLSDSKGSFRKTSVMPFCLENTNITNPLNLKSLNVICNGIVKPLLAANGLGLAKLGLLLRYVLSGFACTFVLSVKNASPVYVILNMPLKRSSARSPISRMSRSGGVEPTLSSVTRMSETMMGGFGVLFRAVVRRSRARVVSKVCGDQLKLKAIAFCTVFARSYRI